ncbi:MAG: HAMP domain-containing protein [Actinomycetales bacterium]|nr:HAMP domain-containing protein [Actinomycetales bacterium]
MRLILLGTLGLSVGLAAGGAALVTILGHAVQRGIDAEAVDTANDVAALVSAGALPEVVPVTGGHTAQVIDARHRVLAASIGADRLVPLLNPAQLDAVRSGDRLTLDASRIGETGSLRVVAVSVRYAGTPDGTPVTVVVARPTAEALRNVATLRDALLVTYPLLVAVLAALGWRVAGAVLRPVESLRVGAERITGTDGDERLPVPPSRDEVHRLATTLNDMIDRLSTARNRQRAFVADAAHELRSPLAAIRTQLEIAERLDEPAPVDDLLADVARLTRLVDDLLLLARTDGGGVIVRPAPVDLRELLENVAERHATARVPVLVDGEPEAEPVVALVDPFLLHRVVANLLDNAVRHAAGRVRLAVAEEGTGADRHVLLMVTDDGPGIPAADRARVFQRFTRLDEARSRDRGGGGSGLGLAIVGELVRLHGGRVRLRDAGPGLRVEVLLPWSESPVRGSGSPDPRR